MKTIKQFKNKLEQVNKNHKGSLLDYVHLFLIKQFPEDYKTLRDKEERKCIENRFDYTHQQLETLDYSVSLYDIILDLNKDVTKGKIFEYYQYSEDNYSNYVNYNSWLMGYRHSKIKP